LTGISIESSSASIWKNTITGCKTTAIDVGGAGSIDITGNSVQSNWAGITMFGAGTSIYNNLIQGNQNDAINMVNIADAEIYQNIISENGGNGIFWLVPYYLRGPQVVNNTIYNNRGAGISANGFDANVHVVNNIIVGNPAILVSNYYNTEIPIIEFNDVFSWAGNAYSGIVSNLDGVSGNISVDPAFACPAGGDYHPTGASLCLDSGNNSAVTNLTVTDFDGKNRFIAADINKAPNVDMGAFEFDPQWPVTPTCAYVFCPSNITILSPDDSAVAVEYPQPVGTPGAIITCLPPSGTFFPPGTNAVYCSASVGTNIDTCTFTVTVLFRPPNDEMENATIIKSLPFEDVTDTSGATRSESDGNCLTMSGTVWYKFQSKKNQEITISSGGSDHQSNFAVLAKNRRALDLVMCGQNGFIAHAGRTYYIMVENYGKGGRLHLTVTAQPILKVYASIAHTAVISGGRIHYHGMITATRPTTVDVYGGVWLPLPSGKIGLDYIWFRMECNGKSQTWDCTGAMPVNLGMPTTFTQGSVRVLLSWYATDESMTELGKSDNTVRLLPQYSPRKLPQSNSRDH
jgi:parallel beta-helix repeat protein